MKETDNIELIKMNSLCPSPNHSAVVFVFVGSPDWPGSELTAAVVEVAVVAAAAEAVAVEAVAVAAVDVVMLTS